jgi:hypothetical protein
MRSQPRSLFRSSQKKALLALLATISLLSGACGGNGEQAQPGGDTGSPDVQVTPTPGSEDLLPGEGSPTAETPETPETDETPPTKDPGTPPPPGKTTEAEFEVEGRGTDPSEGQDLPVILLATSPEEGAAAAGASPAPGAAGPLQQWDQYGERAVVAVLGGSQPDPAHRVVVRGVDFIKNGTVLLVSGTIVRKEGPASQVISIPWVVLSVPAEAADTVTKCTIALEGASPFTTACP